VQTRHQTHPEELSSLPSTGLRDRFLVPDLFAPGEVRFVHSHHDRVVIGGAVPAGQTLTLPVPAELRADRFTDRRELAVVCLSGSGTVTVADEKYPVEAHDVLYVGRGAGDVHFDGADARYYLVSAPAHATHPTALARRAEVDTTDLGEQAHANVRTIRKYVHAGGVRSCQLVLGITTLAEGSVWNTMPCHTHDRRTEVYLYFDLAETERIVHLCGRPDATRSIIVANEQAVISPSWSVHCGCGTANYAFVWAMAGENQAFDDMDQVAKEDLR
jgi:4-deoxy-L-threo-5-hexosulose-uronate ketol-isomerase